MPRYNRFLDADFPAGPKGGEQTIEDPSAVENFVFQTRGGPLDPFEDGLADQLMAVFGDGAEELEDVIRALNAAGSRDARGAEWTARSFEDQMAKSAASLFAMSQGEGR